MNNFKDTSDAWPVALNIARAVPQVHAEQVALVTPVAEREGQLVKRLLAPPLDPGIDGVVEKTELH